jgi:uncharacterized protein (TIGR03086 family)
MAQHDSSTSLSSDPLVADLARGLDAVGVLLQHVGPDQWAAATPCSEWDVRRLVQHLTGMNLVFTALMYDEAPPPRPAPDAVDEDPVGSFRSSAHSLVSAFQQPGVLEREYVGPLGTATGAERLRIRFYDLLAHGWDLARATGQTFDVPEDLAERALVFVRTQLRDEARPGRFAPAQGIADGAPALERLVAFLGRQVG